MSRILFRQIPKDAKLLAVGNFFRANSSEAPWRLASIFSQKNEMEQRQFGLEMSCILGIGREFVAEDEVPYRSNGFQKKLKLPPIAEWREKLLGECPRLAKRLARNSEVASQRCFVFEADGLTVWLPKFELARKLFFHAGFLARSAFEPSGLDMIFSVQRDQDAIHIHTPAKTGVPARLLQMESYRDLFSWLLLSEGVKQSFESIWRCLNQERFSSGGRYTRWQFNFDPPATISGASMEVLGPLDWDSKEILVWEIKTLQGLELNCFQPILFHHPALKLSVSGEGGGTRNPSSSSDDIILDGEEDTDEDKDRQLLDLPMEGLSFRGQRHTRAVYQGQRASRFGQKLEGEELPGDGILLGLCDDVTGGEIPPTELQQLEGQQEEQQEAEVFPNRFESLKEIIKQIAKQPDIESVAMEVEPLPQVLRRSYHKMEDGSHRCYLKAHFKLKNGQEKFLLEVDTSDNKKRLSTRIVRMRPGVNPSQAILQILKDTVQASLRWPVSIETFCDVNEPIHHPKEDFNNLTVRQQSWLQRLLLCVRS
ncbi:Tn7-like element transposition protein TnsE [Aeromonas mytilicola subsp. aquatica]|uniref:Tn7-like element transposition protein TnsE n=1 Tax=Aeromonas mytilicola TaxID=3377113 RepID=UPI0037C05BEA